MAVKVAAASCTLFALPRVVVLTRQLIAIACEAVASVKICTSVVVCGELLLPVNPSVTVQVALAIPLTISSESVGLPQSPFVAPVNRVTCGRSSSMCGQSSTAVSYMITRTLPLKESFIIATTSSNRVGNIQMLEFHASPSARRLHHERSSRSSPAPG